jgi:hypothetical protein
MARPANDELVAVAFLKTLHADLATIVATRLPTDPDAWSATGFVVVRGMGGDQHAELPWQRPNIQIDVYAVNPNSDDPPWDKAADLASLIATGARDMTKLNQALTLRTGYDQARVTALICQRPRRQTGDPANYAWYQIDAQLDWVPLT